MDIDLVEDHRADSAQSDNNDLDSETAAEEIEKSSKKLEQNLKKDNLQTEEPASQTAEAAEQAGDLDIESLARIFSGEIIEVDQSILENRGGN